MELNSENALKNRQHGAMEYSDAPDFLDEVRLYRLNRVRAALQAHDCAGALLMNQINTRYATDSTNMQIWSQFHEARGVFVCADGPVVLFDYFRGKHLVEDLPTIDDYRMMPRAARIKNGKYLELARQIADLMRIHGGGNKRIIVDQLSFSGVDALRDVGLTVVDGSSILVTARRIKSDGEIALMRKAIDACEIGMRNMHEALEPGITENQLWAILNEANIACGGEFSSTRLLSSGPRTNPWWRECSMRKVERGDMVSFDTDMVGPFGYCADISRAWVCGGKPTDEQRRLYAMAVEQINHNRALMRPGMSFREISELAWPIPDECLANRYVGIAHGIGLVDEAPAIRHKIDFDEMGLDGILEVGTCMCVEAMIAVEGGKEGVKLEEQILITQDGYIQLSSYPLELSYV